MNSEVATYAVSSTLTMIVFIAIIIGIYLSINFIYNIYRLKKSRKVLQHLNNAEVVSFDKKGIPVLIKYKENKETKWMSL